MFKNFDQWNGKKKELHEQSTNKYCHEREVWWCSLGVNVGYEQDGTGTQFDRPVVVVRGFNQNVFFGVALTGKKKFGEYYFYLGEIDGTDATAVLSQVRLIDTKRLVRKITTLDETIFQKLKVALREVLFG